MSHADANFRNTATGTLPILYDANGRLAVNVPQNVPAYPPFLELTCGLTLEADLVKWGIHSFFRTASLITNMSYYARECNFRMDEPKRVTIYVTSTEFDPYIAVVRDVAHKWTSTNGVLVFEVDATTEGPFVVEVTSMEKLQTGHFTIQVVCEDVTPPVPTYSGAWLRLYRYFDHDTQLAMSQSDFVDAWQRLRTLANAYDLSTLTEGQMTVLQDDGATLSPLIITNYPSGSFCNGGLPGGDLPIIQVTNGALICTSLYDDWWYSNFVGNEYYLYCERFAGGLPQGLTLIPIQFPHKTRVAKAPCPNYAQRVLSGPVFGLGDFPGPLWDPYLDLTYTQLSETADVIDTRFDLTVEDVTSSAPNFYLWRGGGGEELIPSSEAGIGLFKQLGFSAYIPW